MAPENEDFSLDYSYVDEFEDELVNKSSGKRALIIAAKVILMLLLLTVISVGAFTLGTHAKSKSASSVSKLDDTQVLLGRVSITEVQLRELVRKHQLTAYWSGPEPSTRYTLYIPKPGVAIVRYLPNGVGLKDASPNFRVVATYKLKDAFASISSAGKKIGSFGYITVDGNAAFYVKSRPTNVYLGIKDKDLQIEIFDPNQDQAIALSLFQGKIRRIT